MIRISVIDWSLSPAEPISSEAEHSTGKLVSPWRHVSNTTPHHGSRQSQVSMQALIPSPRTVQGMRLVAALRKSQRVSVSDGKLYLVAGVFAQGAVPDRPAADHRRYRQPLHRGRQEPLLRAGTVGQRRHHAAVRRRHLAAVARRKIGSAGAGNAGELGKTPENTPRRTFSLFGEYRLPQVRAWH